MLYIYILYFKGKLFLSFCSIIFSHVCSHSLPLFLPLLQRVTPSPCFPVCGAKTNSCHHLHQSHHHYIDHQNCCPAGGEWRNGWREISNKLFNMANLWQNMPICSWSRKAILKLKSKQKHFEVGWKSRKGAMLRLFFTQNDLMAFPSPLSTS